MNEECCCVGDEVRHIKCTANSLLRFGVNCSAYALQYPSIAHGAFLNFLQLEYIKGQFPHLLLYNNLRDARIWDLHTKLSILYAAEATNWSKFLGNLCWQLSSRMNGLLTATWTLTWRAEANCSSGFQLVSHSTSCLTKSCSVRPKDFQ